MPPNMRPLLRMARLQSALSRGPRTQRTYASGTPGESEQAFPIGLYYEAILAKPQPKPEVKPQPKLEAKPEVKPQPKLEAKPEAKPQPKLETKPEAKPQPKLETKPEVKPQSKLESKPEEPAAPPPKGPRPPQKKANAQAKAKKQNKNQPPPQPSNASPSGTISTETQSPAEPPATAEQRARIIFGSRLAGPAERADRLQSIRARSAVIAGVVVPPRPEEPDNCCMGGCANCVWDRYRDEMEEWAAASALAAEKQKAQRQRAPEPGIAPSMDDDGGGSEANWSDRSKITKDLWDDGLYDNLPVGIREFMKHEKRLKEKHKKEGSFRD
ncbi:oxidoreductase-like protein [Xylaria intraflava]|nr:oxidoreductase-like protein [Xylaria intraflava]